MNPDDLLSSLLDQQRIPGGCDRCDAFQTMRTEHGVYFLTVHHDDWCPVLRDRRGPEKSA